MPGRGTDVSVCSKEWYTDLSCQERATRLRASTLGAGFGQEDILAVIAGERPVPELPADAPASARRIDLIIDIQARLNQGKGPGFERWAKVYNLKQMAAALQFLQEHGLTEYAALEQHTTAAVERFRFLTKKLQTTEASLSKTSELMGAVVNYSKTGPCSKATRPPGIAKSIWRSTGTQPSLLDKMICSLKERL